MALASPIRPPRNEPIPIDARAADHLRYIRETMASAAEFTAVPGWGGVAMGITAIAAAGAASRQSSPRAWLTVWLIEAFVAVAIAGATAATKAHRANAALFSGPGRKFLLSFTPPIIVGGCLTFALFHLGAVALLPAVWLLLYGTAIVTGGAFSVRVVPGHGFVPDGARRHRAGRARKLGRRIHGGRLRRAANRFWSLDRETSRGIVTRAAEFPALLRRMVVAVE